MKFTITDFGSCSGVNALLAISWEWWEKFPYGTIFIYWTIYLYNYSGIIS